MKILLTGSNGYIAENIIKRYPGRKFKLCDYNTELPPAHQLTMNDIEDCDGIIHLAALSGIVACENNPTEAVGDNILAAQNVFKLGYQKNIPVVFSSSQATKDPSSSVYAYMKWTCEQIANYYNNEGGKIYPLRFSNIYGGYGYLIKKQTCVKQFVTSYKNNEPLVVHGNGEQKRDFIHVWDVIEFVMRVFSFLPEEKDPIDIGTGIGNSVIKLANIFPGANIEFKNTRSAGTDSSIADIKEAQRRLYFKAERKLEDYIKEQI